MRVLLIIPAYNESENLINLVNEIRQKAAKYDYIIVNDGSTDNTRDLCQNAKINVINLPVNLGIGGAVQTGYLYAYNEGYDIAVQIDGDGQHDPAYISELIAPIIEGKANFCVGSRFIQNQGFLSSFARRMGISWLNTLLRLLTGMNISDATSGFRAVDRMVIKHFVSYYPYDYPEPETISDAARMSYVIQEVPVIMRERSSGKSSIRLFNTVYYMVKVTLAILISKIKR